MATLLKVLNNLADIKSAGGVALRVRTQAPRGFDEEAQEQVAALRTAAASCTSDNPPHCVICRDPTVYPSLIGYARSASKSPFLVAMVVCRPCSDAAETAPTSSRRLARRN
jgi:hypothetical protein